MFTQETSRKGQLGLFQLEKTEFQKLDKNQIPLPDSKVPKDCTELPLVARIQMAEAEAKAKCWWWLTSSWFLLPFLGFSLLIFLFIHMRYEG